MGSLIILAEKLAARRGLQSPAKASTQLPARLRALGEQLIDVLVDLLDDQPGFDPDLTEGVLARAFAGNECGALILVAYATLEVAADLLDGKPDGA